MTGENNGNGYKSNGHIFLFTGNILVEGGEMLYDFPIKLLEANHMLNVSSKFPLYEGNQPTIYFHGRAYHLNEDKSMNRNPEYISVDFCGSRDEAVKHVGQQLLGFEYRMKMREIKKEIKKETNQFSDIFIPGYVPEENPYPL